MWAAVCDKAEISDWVVWGEWRKRKILIFLKKVEIKFAELKIMPTFAIPFGNEMVKFFKNQDSGA